MLRSYNEAIILAYSMDRIYANYKRSVYAAISLANFGFFEIEIGPLLYFRYSRNLKYRFFPVFSLLQSLLKATKDVDSFFMMIISTFGFFNVEKKDVSNHFDENDQRIILFILFHFILCLIFDTFCAE